jgi:hypothetical protein
VPRRTAIEEYDRDYLKERNNIDEAYEDLRFRRGTLQINGTRHALDARKGRPCHVVNKLPQFIRQVTGDMRRKRPGIKVVPVDSGADIETADVRGGMIRYVENRIQGEARLHHGRRQPGHLRNRSLAGHDRICPFRHVQSGNPDRRH